MKQSYWLCMGDIDAKILYYTIDINYIASINWACMGHFKWVESKCTKNGLFFFCFIWYIKVLVLIHNIMTFSFKHAEILVPEVESYLE